MTIERLHVDGPLIVGAGPVGLTLALALARSGVEVLVVERSSGLDGASHASTFHPTSLEVLESVGVARRLIDRGLPVDTLQYRYLPEGLAVRLHYDVLRDDTRYPFRLQCEQQVLREILVDELQRESRARVRFDSPVTSLHVDDRPIASIGGARPARCEATCIIGADGAHSTVRHELGVDFRGSAYTRPLLRIMSTPDVRHRLPDLDPVTYMADDEGSMSMLTLPDHVRFGFRVSDDLPEDVATSGAHVNAHLRRLHRAGDGFPVRGAQLIALHQRLAETFSLDGVFLVGDAAHLNDPSGGMGMNSGIHDAGLLAELLRRHLREGESLQHAHRAMKERRDVISQQVIRAAEAHRSNLDQGRGAEWIAGLAETASDPDRTRAYLRRASMFHSFPPLLLRQ